MSPPASVIGHRQKDKCWWGKKFKPSKNQHSLKGWDYHYPDLLCATPAQMASPIPSTKRKNWEGLFKLHFIIFSLECGAALHNSSGIIQSPRRVEDVECTWDIYPEDGNKSVLLTFGHFNLPLSFRCEYVAVAVVDYALHSHKEQKID